jgi:pimeloyl-ACP methyl ester carboxylesterase
MKKTVQFQGKSLSYQVSGTGPALVLLHGFLESKAIWDDFTHSLEKYFTVVAIDLPGHGESELLAETHSMQLMAGAVKAVLRAENIEIAVIAGHSMGGYVALQFAVDYEEMVKGLVLFHSHANADSDEARENRRRTIEIVRKNRHGFIMQFIPDLFDQRHVENYREDIQKLQDVAALMTPEAIIAALSGMRDRPGQHQFLLKTEIPVLSILGKQDSRMPFNQLMVQAVIPSHSEILLLDDVGHMGFIEAPGKTMKALKHFAMRCFEE